MPEAVHLILSVLWERPTIAIPSSVAEQIIWIKQMGGTGKLKTAPQHPRLMRSRILKGELSFSFPKL